MKRNLLNARLMILEKLIQKLVMLSRILDLSGVYQIHCGVVMVMTPARLQVCLQTVGYQTARTRPCNTFQCSSQADCSNHGSCNATTKACACSPGYQGPSCNVFQGPCTPPSPNPGPGPTPPAPSSSQQTFCCPTGVVDYLGSCCQSGILSRFAT